MSFEADATDNVLQYTLSDVLDETNEGVQQIFQAKFLAVSSNAHVKLQKEEVFLKECFTRLFQNKIDGIETNHNVDSIFHA